MIEVKWATLYADDDAQVIHSCDKHFSDLLKDIGSHFNCLEDLRNIWLLLTDLQQMHEAPKQGKVGAPYDHLCRCASWDSEQCLLGLLRKVFLITLIQRCA